MLKQVDNFIKSEVYKSLKNNPQKNYYRLLGLRRSGNHAFINWLLPQIEGITLFVDNVQRGDPNNNVNKKLQVRGLDPMNLLISHEDRELEAFYLGHQERWYGNSSRTVTMVILRDPYNWMASWYAWTDNLGHQFRKDKEFRDRTIELWKKYATLCLQWQSNDESEKRQEQKVFINYNQWASSIDYRQSMAKKLGLTFNDKGKNKVSINGYGSSFSGVKHDGSASQLKVLERWKQFTDEPVYLSCFDSEIHELAQKLFPKVASEFRTR